MATKNEVLKFIDKFKFIHKKEIEEVFTTGNCYYFALILKERFEGSIYYLPIENHFITKIDKFYFDITGLVEPKEQPMNWKMFQYEDEKLCKRVTRDCITFDTRKV